MANTTIYVGAELKARLDRLNLPVSKICQKALRTAATRAENEQARQARTPKPTTRRHP